jgi:hypothetical protein
MEERAPLLAFKKDGKVFMVGVDPFNPTAPFFGIIGSGGNNLYFESTDCSGPPLMNWLGESVLPTVVTAPRMTVYVPDTSFTAKQVTFNSYLLDVSYGGGCGQYTNSDSLVPAVPVVDLASVFTPPFSVRGY